MGYRAYAEGRFKVNYAEGCKITKQTPSFWGDNETPNDKVADDKLITEALACAQRSDVIFWY